MFSTNTVCKLNAGGSVVKNMFPPYILFRGVTHVVIVTCNYPLSVYTNCNSSL